MSFDAHKNFAVSTVATAPSPATSGTSLVVAAGEGSKFPTPPFNASVWPANVQPTTANAEIVRVTAAATDTLTITRAQESTSARSIGIGDQIAATITAKVVTDIETGADAAPATITSTGTVNDLSTGLTLAAGRTYTLRCNNATLLTINGIAGGVDGALLRIVSVGAGQVNLAHQNAGSTAANRLLNIITSGITPLAAGAGVATLLYDGTTARWRLVQHDQGAPIDVAYNASDFTSASTWTVDSGDVNRHSYMVRGREVTEYLEIITSSVGASPGSALMSLIPNGWSASGRGFSNNMYNDGSGYVMGASWINGGAGDLTHLRHFKSDFSSAWSASTNATYLYVTMTYWIS